MVTGEQNFIVRHVLKNPGCLVFEEWGTVPILKIVWDSDKHSRLGSRVQMLNKEWGWDLNMGNIGGVSCAILKSRLLLKNAYRNQGWEQTERGCSGDSVLRSYLGSKVSGICKCWYRVRPLKKGVSGDSVAPGTYSQSQEIDHFVLPRATTSSDMCRKEMPFPLKAGIHNCLQSFFFLMTIEI